MAEAKFLSKLAEILDRDAFDVTRETELPEGTFDSLALLSTIAAIDEEFDATVSLAKLQACRSVGALLDLVAAASGKS